METNAMRRVTTKQCETTQIKCKHADNVYKNTNRFSNIPTRTVARAAASARALAAISFSLAISACASSEEEAAIESCVVKGVDAAVILLPRLLLLLSLLLCIRRGLRLLDEDEKPWTTEPVDAATATAARAVEAVYIRCRPRVRDWGDEDGEGDMDDDMIALAC